MLSVPQRPHQHGASRTNTTISRLTILGHALTVTWTEQPGRATAEVVFGPGDRLIIDGRSKAEVEETIESVVGSAVLARQVRAENRP